MLNQRKQYGMAKALRVVNLPMEGTHHRGIDDVKNIVKLLPYIIVENPYLS
jgi:inhibitor of KinA sporulation pathway (predicted exonuclease)